MLIEMARMSVEDGLVMQLHVGLLPQPQPARLEQFGADKGDDIPVATEWVHNLKPLLDDFGNDPRLTLILFTMDETSYTARWRPWPGTILR